VAELADAHGLGPCGAIYGGSSPSARTSLRYNGQANRGSSYGSASHKINAKAVAPKSNMNNI